VEHYQQEAGRAGRDRLEAECVLLYSGADVMKWRDIMGTPETVTEQAALDKLFEMSNYAQRVICRHKFLVEYFGQTYPKTNCGRCDCCLGEFEVLGDSITVAQKILSCVYRVGEKFGAAHVAQVLMGSNREKILQFKHHELSTYGLLSQYRQDDIQQWIEQLINQDFMFRDPAYGALRLTLNGGQLLKSREGEVLLSKPVVPQKSEKGRKKLTDKHAPEFQENWLESDSDLFEALRQCRLRLAKEHRVAPFIVFSDATLREMVLYKPKNLYGFRGLKGVGERKLRDFCPQFLEVIKKHGTNSNPEQAEHDETGTQSPKNRKKFSAAYDSAEWPEVHASEENGKGARANQSKMLAMSLFAQGEPLDFVVARTGKTYGTVSNYLTAYIKERQLTQISPWLSEATYQAVSQAVFKVGSQRLQPIFEELNGSVNYDEIRIALAFLENRSMAYSES